MTDTSREWNYDPISNLLNNFNLIKQDQASCFLRYSGNRHLVIFGFRFFRIDFFLNFEPSKLYLNRSKI